MRIISALAVCCTVLCTGCAHVQPVQTTTINEDKPELIVPDYPALDLKRVHFQVQVLENNVYYCLDTQNYKNLAEDIKVVQEYIKYLKQVNYTYKEYYEGLNGQRE